MDHADIDHTGLTGAGGSVATDAIWDAAGDLAVGSGANTAAKLSIGATNGMALQRVSGAVAWALPPGYEFDYVAITSQVVATATSEATATTVVTGNAVTYDGSTIILIEFYADYLLLDTNTAGKGIYIWLYDGSSSIGLLEYRANPTTIAGGLYSGAVHVSRRLTPSAAAHTYSIRASKDAGGTTSMTVDAAATAPAYIRITKV